MKINNSRHAGFTLVEIMIVVAIIGLLAAIAIPNFVRARNTSQANSCINNMRQIDAAIQQWALENNQLDTASGANGLAAAPLYIKGGLIPTCPAGNATYTAAATIDLTPVVLCPNAALTPPHVLPTF